MMHANTIADKFEHFSRVLLWAGVFLLPLIALPVTWLPGVMTKLAFVAFVVSVALIMFVVARFNAHTLAIPNTKLLPASLLLILGYGVSALLSTHIVQSFVGFGFERDSVLAMVVFVGALIAVALTHKTDSHVIRLHQLVIGSFIVFGLFQLVRIVFGAENILPGIFSSNVTSTVLGSWNDIAMFSGVVLTLALAGMSFLALRTVGVVVMYALALLSLFFLVIVNLTAAWVGLAVVSFVLALYVVADASYDRETGTFTPSFPLKRVAPSIVVFIVGVVFAVGGAGISNRVADALDVSFLDIRPSWEGTVATGAGVYQENALFGTGPNSFSDAWVAHRPSAITQTTFWNTNFNFGIGLIPTAFVTGGLVLSVLWLVFLGLFLWLGIRLIGKRMASPTRMYLVISTYLATLFMWLLSILYVPQTSMVAYTFMFTGAVVAIAHIAGVFSTRELSAQSGYKSGIGFMASLLVIAMVSVGTLVVYAERVYAGALLSRAVAQANEGSFDRALFIADRSTLLFDDARSDQLAVNVGLARMSQLIAQTDGDPETLRREFQEAITQTVSAAQRVTEKDPADYRNWIMLGDVYAQLIPFQVEGALENAQSAYTTARDRNPKNPGPLVSLARLALAQEDMATAKTYLGTALELKANYTDAYYLLSQIAIREGDASTAIRTTQAAVVLQPRNPGLLFQLGVLYYSLGNYGEVVSALERAVALNPRYANALYFLGLAYDQVGEQENALATFERVAELNPGNTEVQRIVTALTEGNSAVSALGGSAPDITEDTELPVQEVQ